MRTSLLLMRAAWIGVVAVASAPSFGQPAITAVPPARFPGAVQKAHGAPALRVPGLAASRVIDLGPASAAEVAPIGRVERRPVSAPRPLSAGPGGVGRLQIGVARRAPAALASVTGEGLDWHDDPAGGRVARIEVRSGSAAGLRLQLSAAGAEGIDFRFAGSAAGAAFGPYAGSQLAPERPFWSPVLEGERAIVEVHAPREADVRRLTIRIAEVSHLGLVGAALKDVRQKRERDIGQASDCQTDVACVSNASAALRDAASAVAQVVVTDRGSSFLCSGTVINDSIGSFRPYFTTGHHCVRTQAVADTVNTYWFFDASACDSTAVPPYVLLTGGARLLAASNDHDWTLLQLREQPPAGVVYSAWRAEPLAFGSLVSTLHHPRGDLKKFSQGTATGYSTETTFHRDGYLSGGGTFLDVFWTQGSTEAGSSGAGVFTFFEPGGHYELRGTLFGGDAACTNPTGLDWVSRLDLALPLLKEYLTPNVGYPTGLRPVVEYYHRGLDHHFITADPREIAILDAQAGIVGWERTGFRFLAYADAAQAPAAATPVCRYSLRPEVGQSHFYSASPAECAEVQSRFGASWVLETASAFWMLLPDPLTGECPATTMPVYRFLRPARLNHRFTSETSLRDDLAYDGEEQEGYGTPPNQVAMCAPRG